AASDRGTDNLLRRRYHSAAQAASLLLLPLASVLVVFAGPFLIAWTRNDVTASKTRWLLILLVIGGALNGLMQVPYALQLAYGWTRLAFFQNLAAAVVLIPLLIWAALRYGAVGAAAVWCALNTSYIVIGIQLMHRRLIPHEKWRWYLYDVGRPLAASLGAVVVVRLAAPSAASRLGDAVLVVTAFAAALAACAAVTPAAQRRVPLPFLSRSRPAE